jgi:hypothetical protein
MNRQIYAIPSCLVSYVIGEERIDNYGVLKT